MTKHRHSEIASLRARLPVMRDVPQREYGFSTREWMEMYGLLEYKGRETFVAEIQNHIESLGYARSRGGMWKRAAT